MTVPDDPQPCQQTCHLADVWSTDDGGDDDDDDDDDDGGADAHGHQSLSSCRPDTCAVNLSSSSVSHTHTLFINSHT